MQGKVTKEEIMALTNMEKRRNFVTESDEWPVWLEVPELKMVVRRIDFPDGSAFCSTLYEGTGATNSYTGYNNNPYFCILSNPDASFRPGNDSISSRIDHVSSVRKKLIEK